MSGTPTTKHYNVDRNLMFAEDLTLTATGNVQFAAADVIYKIGPGRMDSVLIVNVTALDVAGADELYDFFLQGSDSPTFASGIHNLAHLQLGAAALLGGGANVASIIGRYEVPFQNVIAGSIMLDFVRLRLVAAGATKSVTFDAWIAPVS
jgi:hypothetical protein